MRERPVAALDLYLLVHNEKNLFDRCKIRSFFVVKNYLLSDLLTSICELVIFESV